MGRVRISILSVLVALAVFPLPARAQWSTNGNPLCTLAGDQDSPATATDGAGGAFVVWVDNRLGSNDQDLYLQRITPGGTIAPGWTVNGVALCVAVNEQRSPVVVADGVGGVFLAWEDDRAAVGSSDIYVQRITAAGAVAAGWPAGGLPICEATGTQSSPVLTQESGSVIVAWRDERNATSDVYAQKVNASGLLQWAADGVPVCDAAGAQSAPTIVGDKNGGAIVAWEDKRAGITADIYAQRLNGSGAPQWTLGGIALCDSTNDQMAPHAIPDASGGMIVTWDDYRANNSNIYAQRVNGAGAAQWVAGGVALCADPGEQYGGVPVSDGSGGAIVPWTDFRFAAASVFAQKISASGAPAWPANGLEVCAIGDVSDPVASPDGTGGAFFVWDGVRTGSNGVDLYGVRMTAAGAVGNGWTLGGSVVCNAANNQLLPVVTTDASGGLIASWFDGRGGTNDIYAKRLAQGGTVDVPVESPSALALAAAPNPMTTRAAFQFSLPTAQPAGLQVLDVTGRVVRTLLESHELPAGPSSIEWDGRDASGQMAPAGLYFVRLATRSHTEVRTIARLR